MKNFKKVISLLLIFMLFSVNTFASDYVPKINVENGETMYNFLKLLINVTAKNYRFDITEEELWKAAVMEVMKAHPELFDEFADGAYTALDANSNYLTLEEYQSSTEDIMGSFVGVGITLFQFEELVMVSGTVENTPAYRAGLKAGDIITHVNDEAIKGYSLDKVVEMVRGEKGTSVTLTIKRGNEAFDVSIVRDDIPVIPVSYENLGNGIGYVKLAMFSANTAGYMDEALYNLHKQGVTKIVLDLRDNLGGVLTQAVNTASYFLPDNTLVVTEDFKNENKNVQYKSRHTDEKFDVAVLINEYSASASEIVAGAIKDNNAGTLIGTTSFGKGTVQQVIPLKNGGAVYLTIARYLTPSGDYIHEKGIDPHILVNNSHKPVDVSKLEKLSGTGVLTEGSTGKDVLAIEQRLEILGYPITPDENYDSQTFEYVKDFQHKTELFPYGVCDLTTQIKLADEVVGVKVLVDNQLNKAIEVLKNK